MEDVAHEDMQDQHEESGDWCEEAWDWADWELWVQLLALKHEWVEVLQEQNAILDQAMQAMDNNHLALDTVLALAVAFLLLAT